MKYSEIKKKREDDTNELMTSLGVFWAFSNQQFNENKTPLQEGEKYVDIGSGGFIPKHNVDAFMDGMEKIAKEFKEAIAAFKLREKHILYELNNHECFYTGNVENALPALGAEYTQEEVQTVYKKFKAKKYVKA